MKRFFCLGLFLSLLGGSLKAQDRQWFSHAVPSLEVGTHNRIMYDVNIYKRFYITASAGFTMGFLWNHVGLGAARFWEGITPSLEVAPSFYVGTIDEEDESYRIGGYLSLRCYVTPLDYGVLIPERVVERDAYPSWGLGFAPSAGWLVPVGDRYRLRLGLSIPIEVYRTKDPETGVSSWGKSYISEIRFQDDDGNFAFHKIPWGLEVTLSYRL